MWNQMTAEDRITRADELRSLVGAPHETVVKKTIAQVDSHVRQYLSKSPCSFYLRPIQKEKEMFLRAVTSLAL